MFFISVEDFLIRAESIECLRKGEEKVLAQRMADGDASARDMLIKSHLRLVAAHVRRVPQRKRTLNTVYKCITEVEKGVDSFNFQQDGETFAHHLGWRLRQCIVRCLAEEPEDSQ